MKKKFVRPFAASAALAGLALCSVTLPTRAADDAPPPIPDHPLAVKKEQLISEDFSNPTDHDKRWHNVVPTFTWENGALKGHQERIQNELGSDGKVKNPAHAAVYGVNIPTKDSVVETKIKFDGCNMVDVEYDDRAFTGSHYGHLCRAQVHLNNVTILDERDGSQSNQLIELRKDAVANKEAIAKLQRDHQVRYPVQLEAGKWYDLTVEVAGDEMRVSIDGKAVAYFKSSGIGHATKSKIEIGVGGRDGWFDDFKVWNAEPAK